MKKTMILAILATLAIAFAGCSSSTSESSAAASGGNTPAATQGEGQAAGDGWVFENNGVQVTMNAPAAPIIEKLGAYKSSYEAPSCAFDGMDVVYSYSGFDLLTYSAGGAEAKVSGVVLRDDTVETKEGLFIGSDKAAVESTYGKMEDGANNLRITKGNCELLVILTDGYVSSIQYIAKQ